MRAKQSYSCIPDAFTELIWIPEGLDRDILDPSGFHDQRWFIPEEVHSERSFGGF